MRFNYAKCKVLHLGCSNPSYVHCLGELTECTPPEKNYRVLLDENLCVSQQCVLVAWKANCILGWR